MTFWFGNSNYGQLLQCWALQQYLELKGHEPFVIKYLALGEPWWKCHIRRILNRKAPVSVNDAKRDFEGFRNRYFRFSKLYTSLKQIQSYPPKYDAYIAGSDQIWVHSLDNNQVHPYFLNFGESQVKRIAYAPSFGMTEYPAKDQNKLKNLLSNIDAISCREYSGVNICNKIGFKATKVVDPTLLLTKDVYTKALHLHLRDRCGLFIYSLNINSPEEIQWTALKLLAKEKCWEIFVTPASGYNEGTELFGNEVKYIYSTPENWLEQIANSELVVTTSFHGVVFSIIMHTPFVYIPLSGEHSKSNNRVLDLLNDLQLGDRALTADKDIKVLIDNAINWQEADLRLKKLRSESEDFILNAIK